MASGEAPNPFLKLFQNTDGKNIALSNSDDCSPVARSVASIPTAYEHSLLEKVLSATLDVAEEDDTIGGKFLLTELLSERLADGNESLLLELSEIKQVLTERLKACSAERIRVSVSQVDGTVTPAGDVTLDFILSSHCLGYLFSCYKRLVNLRTSDLHQDIDVEVRQCVDTQLVDAFLDQCIAFLLDCNSFSSQQEICNNQLAVLFYNGTPIAAEFVDFFKMLTRHLHKTLQDETSEKTNEILKHMGVAVNPLIELLRGFMYDVRIRFQMRPTVTDQYLPMLEYFLTDHIMSRITMQISTCFLPAPQPNGMPPPGKHFEVNTVLGLLLACSTIMPRGQKNAFFDTNPLAGSDMSNVSLIETSMRQQINFNCTSLSKILIASCRVSSANRRRVLQWLAACLYLNNERSKMFFNPFSVAIASDGFFLNLNYTLLLMCAPFLSVTNKRLAMIEAEYATFKPDESTPPDDVTKSTWHPMLSFLHEETKVADSDDAAAKLNDVWVGFTTECFFLTHRSLQLGLLTSAQMYRREDEAFNRLHAAYQQSRAPPELVNTAILQQLGFATHLYHPGILQLCMKFYEFTSAWLIKVILPDNCSVDISKPDELTTQLQWPISDLRQAKRKMAMIPEFLLESVPDFLKTIRHAPTRAVSLLEESAQELSTILSMIVIFLSHKDLVRSPHLRAKLAECMVWLLPDNSFYSSQVQSVDRMQLSTMTRQQLFATHSLAKRYLPMAILTVFVDIEFTGETEQFEQKFQYRHPILTIFQHIFPLAGYRQQFATISDESVDSIESSREEVHVFTRFLNMLVNDAIFLLDEAMGLLARIKELEQEKTSGAWNSLEAAARKEKEDQLAEVKRLSKPHNFLANATVKTLAMFCAQLVRPFTCSTMLDRMVAFLNYFLKQLVGPKMSALRVNDFAEHAFKPKQLVKDIVSIYISLGKDERFVEAVPKDGRSYSQSLLSQARSVLGTLNEQDLLGEWFDLSQRILEEEERNQSVDQNDSEAPAEFLDPIMSCVMSDPVRLPTSGNVVDRVTIMRHLLTDQSDPFNRSPLTPDMLEALPDLRRRIEEWKATASAASPTSS
ncbi:ubiquitin conjugation factor E4 A-like [Sycon ciliatum]|uniref:ubiquitin conjugation factor E4 A-like n=1 Tax=Sycon ciliatum TaxID=27933 RepID=UPI0020AB68FB|eukprot:scpid21206/ scgid32784/ Ubiquitin conjugation factor E4 A